METDLIVFVGICVFVLAAYIVGTVVEMRASAAVRKMDRSDNAPARFAAMEQEMKGWVKR
jgi:hypothetical protein